MSAPINPKEERMRGAEFAEGAASPATEGSAAASAPIINRRDFSSPAEKKMRDTQIGRGAVSGQIDLPLLNPPDETLAETGDREITQIGAALTTSLKEKVATLSTTSPITDEQLRELLKSSDPAKIYTSLVSSVDLKELSAAEQEAATDYLSILAKALALMSTMRQQMLTVETEATAKQGEAKIAAQQTMINVSLNQYESSLKTIQSNLETALANIKAAEKAKLWGWLGPVITAVSSFVAIVTIVATLGAAAPVMAGALVTLTGVMSTMQILDQTIQIGDKAFDALGVPKDAGIRESLKFVAMAIMIAVSVAGGLAAGGGAAAQAAQIGAAAAANVSSSVAVLTVSALFSSGLITLGLTKMLIAAGAKEDDAMLASMILTVVLMLGMMMAASKAAGSIANKFVGAGSGLKNAEDAAGKAAEGAAARSIGAAGGMAGVQQNAVKATQEQITAQTRSLLEGFQKAAKEALKNPILYANTILVIAGAFKVVASVEQAKLESSQAELSGIEATLERGNAELTALYDYLKKLLPGFDATIKNLQDDSKGIQEFMVSMNATFAQIVAAASNIVNKGTTRG